MKKENNNVTRTRKEIVVERNINLLVFLYRLFKGAYIFEKGKGYQKLQHLVENIEHCREYAPDVGEIKIHLDAKRYNDMELDYWYKKAVEFQTFIEQYLGKNVYTLSERKYSRFKYSMNSPAFFLLHSIPDTELALRDDSMLVLKMEEFALVSRYIVNSNVILERILFCEEADENLN